MDPVLLPLAVALALLVGLALGLLGGGGSILTVPLLVYVLGMDPKEAIATSLVVVGTTSLAGMFQHARAGHVVWRSGLLFGGAGMIGAWLGGVAAGWIPGRVLLLLFAGMMIATAVSMLRSRKAPAAPAPRSVPHVLADGLVVGAVTGLVGAGGGFLVVPALVLLGGLPMTHAIGTSLLVIGMKSFAGWAGHATHVAIDPALTLAITLAAVMGSLLGGALATRVSPEVLRRGFGTFVLVMGVVQIGLELSGGVS